MRELERGELARLAEKAKVSPSHLSDILARRKQPNGCTAMKLCSASKDMRLGVKLEDWLDVKKSKHKLFKGDVQ